MVTLANRYVRAGADVDLVLQQAVGPYLREVHPDVRIIDLRARRLLSSLFPLVRYLRKARPDATLSTPSAANILAVLAWTMAGRPGRLIVREAITASVDDRANSDLRSRLIRQFRRLAYHSASHIVAPSAGVADDLVRNDRLPRTKIAVIANPVDAEKLEAAVAQTGTLDGLRDDLPLILGVGRLSAQKDFATLIRAFAVVQKFRASQLCILGEGEERDALQALAAELGVGEKVLLPGFAENPFLYMKRAAVFALASRYEGLPNALLQAMMLGTAVVATDCPSGPREVLEDGRWGRLVPVGDVQAMADGIIAALDSRLTTPPEPVMRSRYGVDAIAEKYLHVLLPDGVEVPFIQSFHRTDAR